MASLLKFLGQPRFGLMVAMLLLVAGLFTHPAIAQDEAPADAPASDAAGSEGSGPIVTDAIKDALGSVGRSDGPDNATAANSTGATLMREPGYVCAVVAAVLLMAPRVNPLRGLLSGVGSG